MEFKTITIRFERDGQVLRIVLGGSKGNIMTSQMMSEIVACLDQAGAKPELKAIVFSGEGKHFCFGASVKEHQKEKAPAMIKQFNGLFKELLDLSVVTVALVHGQCLGGGMELATFCNFVFADRLAKFAQPEIMLGVFPPVAALILPRIIGQARTDDLILTGRTIDADIALSWGMIYQVAEDLEAAFEEFFTRHLMPKSASSLRFACSAARSHWHATFAEALDRIERYYVDELMETEDANVGIASHLKKRKPEWKDR